MATRQHFATLDGLRGLAAAAVMLRHLTEDFSLPQVVGHGYLAVDLFFILSGFVICWAYERRLDQGWSKAEFARVRLVRLLPMIVLGSLLGGLLTGLERPSLSHLIEATLLSMIALPCPWHGVLFPVDGPLWSMFYELLSNAVYVMVRPRLIGKVLLLAITAAAAATAFVAFRLGGLDAGFLTHHGWAGAPRLAFPFLAGVLIHQLYKRRSILSFRAPAWLLAAVLVAVLVTPNGLGGGGLDIFYSLIVLPALVWLGLHSQVGRRSAGVCALAGELSYPLYVVHKPIEVAMGHLVSHLAAPKRAAAAGGCVIIVVVLASVASRRYDVPVRRFLTELTKPRTRLDPAVAVAVRG